MGYRIMFPTLTMEHDAQIWWSLGKPSKQHQRPAYHNSGHSAGLKTLICSLCHFYYGTIVLQQLQVRSRTSLKTGKLCMSTLKTFQVVNWTPTNQNLHAPVQKTLPEASPLRFPVSTWKKSCSESMLNIRQKHTKEKRSKALWNCSRRSSNSHQPPGKWNSYASTENQALAKPKNGVSNLIKDIKWSRQNQNLKLKLTLADDPI